MSRRQKVAFAAIGFAAAFASIAAWPVWWVSGPLGCACCVIGLFEIRRTERSMIGYLTTALGGATVVTAVFSALVLTASAGPTNAPAPSQTAVQLP